MIILIVLQYNNLKVYKNNSMHIEVENKLQHVLYTTHIAPSIHTAVRFWTFPFLCFAGTWVSSRPKRAPHQWFWTYGRPSTSTAEISISSPLWWLRLASRRPWYSWCQTESADTLKLEQSSRLWVMGWGEGRDPLPAPPEMRNKSKNRVYPTIWGHFPSE